MCLVYTCLTYKNKCRSLIGSDKRFYRNELCFDKEDTLASKTLQELIKDNPLNETEKRLMKYWDDVLFEARDAEEYQATQKSKNPFTYGIWQIEEEINIKIPTESKDKRGKVVFIPKYIELNTRLISLKRALADYYDKEILPLLFKYELIK